MRAERLLSISLVAMLSSLGACRGPEVRAPSGEAVRSPPGRFLFADPDRRAKLARAFPEIDRLVRAEVAEHGIAGLAFGVVIDGELAHFSSAGFADLDAHRAPTLDTVFRIASITKSFTALAVLALRDDGKLRLDDPLTRFVPEARALVAPTRDAAPITLRQILTHTAGLPGSGLFDLAGSGKVSADEIAASLVGDELEGVPGMGFAYSNLGYQVLGVVVERVAREPLRGFLARRLFAPLGMASTSFDGAGLAAGQLAVGYDRDDGGVEEAVPNASYGAAEAAGGIFTSVRDMSRYLALHLGAYPPRDDPETLPLRRSSLREAHQDALRVAPMSVRLRDGAAKGERLVEVREDRYAFGLAIHETCDVDDLVTHNGGLPGWSSAIGFLPRHGVGFVALTNQGRGGRDPTDLIHQAVVALQSTGGLSPRVALPAASPAVRTAMERLLGVYNRWEPAAYHAMLSPHRGPVTEKEEREELAGYRAFHGACRSFSVVSAKGSREARFALRCERGAFEMSLGVDASGLITGFVGTSRGVAAPPEVAGAALRLTSLIGRWDAGVYDSILGEAILGQASLGNARQAEHRAAFEALGHDHGSCLPGAYSRVEGRDEISIACKRGGPLRLELTLSRSRGLVERFAFHEAPVEPTHGACPVR